MLYVLTSEFYHCDNVSDCLCGKKKIRATNFFSISDNLYTYELLLFFISKFFQQLQK